MDMLNTTCAPAIIIKKQEVWSLMLIIKLKFYRSLRDPPPQENKKKKTFKNYKHMSELSDLTVRITGIGKG